MSHRDPVAPTHGVLSPNNLWPCNFVLPSLDQRIMNHPVVFCVTLDPICCNLPSFNKMKAEKDASSTNPSKVVICNLAVITPVSAGFSKAPFEGKNLPESQYLSMIQTDQDHGRELLLTSFEKHNNNEYRGPHRPDVCALVRTGCTLKIMIGKHTFNPKFQSIFEPGMTTIPAFSVVKIVMHCGNANGVSEEKVDGCFIKISKVFRMSNSLSSFLSYMKTFPSNFNSQKMLTETCCNFTKFPANDESRKIPVATMIYGNGGDCAMIVDVNSNLVCSEFDVQAKAEEFKYQEVISDKLEIVKLYNVTSLSYEGEAIKEMDVESWVMRMYTNCQDLQKCCKLVEVAASLKALSIFAVKKYMFNHNPEDKKKLEGLSGFRGVPIINFQKIIGVFWHNGEMRGLKDFLEHLNKNDFKDSKMRFVIHGDEVIMEYSKSSGLITIEHVNRFYTVESESRRVIVRINPLIRTDEVDGGSEVTDGSSMDNQIVHKSMRLQKYCKVHVDLGKPVKSSDTTTVEKAKGACDFDMEVIDQMAGEAEEAEGSEEEDDGMIKNYVSLKMNLSLSTVDWSLATKKEDDSVCLKRKRISMEDADGDSD